MSSRCREGQKEERSKYPVGSLGQRRMRGRVAEGVVKEVGLRQQVQQHFSGKVDSVSA